MRKLFALLQKTLEQGEDAVLVTVVASSGSTPRGTGARMLVTRRGRLRGTVGGGAVEHRSEQIAREALEAKTSRMEHFALRKNEIQDLGMICGGDVTVYFHYIPAGDTANRNLTDAVEERFRRGEQSWLIAEITENRDGALAIYGGESGAVGMEVPDEVLDRLGSKAVQVEADGRRFYCERLVQPGRVYIFGGGHVAQALVPALAAVDFRCVVLEDRKDFCAPGLFPGVEETRLIDNSRINESLSIQADDYVVIMTRGHKDDRTVLAQALGTPAGYIGVIGSARKADSVFASLREEGFADRDIARVTTPIGLAIRSETPAEIAVSIAAQLIQIRAEHTGQRGGAAEG